MSDVPPPPPPPESWSGPPQGPPGLDVGAAVSYAWNKFQQYAGPLVAIAVIIAVVNLAGFLTRFVVDSQVVAVLLQVVLFVVGQILTIGVINAALMVTRGETPDIGRVFDTTRLGPFIVASVLYGLAVIVGLILCILPGIAAALLFSFYGFYILDRDLGPTDALAASWNLVTSNFGSILLLVIVAFAINLVGALLCGIGLIVTEPICWIMLAYGYRYLNSEPIAP